MTDFELALFMYITSVGEGDEEMMGEITSAGVAVRQQLDEAKRENEYFNEEDFFMEQRENFIVGIGRIQNLFQYVEKENET